MTSNHNPEDIFAAIAAGEQDWAKKAIEDAAPHLAKLDGEKAPKKVKDGVYYDSNEENSNGHSISRYRIVIGGKTVLWASVNNDLPYTVDGNVKTIHGLPAGATTHNIFIANADKTKAICTNGFAVRIMHNDGTGVHIDGHTIQTYVVPRISRFLGELYGV